MSKCQQKYESIYPHDINLGRDGIVKAHHTFFACDRDSHPRDIFCNFVQCSREQYDAIATPVVDETPTPNRPTKIYKHNDEIVDINGDYFNLE